MNKNGRAAIFNTKMSDGGSFIFYTVLIWNGKKCTKKLFSLIQNGLQRHFLEKLSSVDQMNDFSQCWKFI